MLRNGAQAPQFVLADQDGTPQSLVQYQGAPLVLIFFRGRFCPTARRSLVTWQDFTRSLADLETAILAVSLDSQAHHQYLRSHYGLTFPLLSDSRLFVSKLYGVYVNRRTEEAEEELPPDGEFGEPALVIVDAGGMTAYSVISSGPKGLPEPGAIAPILIYMHARGGRY